MTGSVSILSWYGVDRPEETIEGSLEELVEERGFLSHTSKLLIGIPPNWVSIPMFIPEDIVGNWFFELRDVVDELKGLEGKENLFAEFPIGTTMQDGGKRKEAMLVMCLFIIYKIKVKEKKNQKKRNIKSRKIIKEKEKY